MTKKYIIYRIVNLINGKFYIGKTSTSIRERWSVHVAHAKYGLEYTKKYKKRVGLTYFANALRKYGVENFEIKELDFAENPQHLCFLEEFYIHYYNSANPKYGYNILTESGIHKEYVTEDEKLQTRIKNYKQRGLRDCLYWDESRKKWAVCFAYDKFKMYKRFPSKDKAIFARDIWHLHFYKENAILIRPEQEQSYREIDTEQFIAELKQTRKFKTQYMGVVQQKNIYMARMQKGDVRVYLGMYDSSEEAALVRDKVCYYLYGALSKFNFPEKVSERYLEEGKSIYNLYSDPARQKIIKGGKTSKFNGVSKRSKGTWEMSFCLNGKKFREVYTNEIDAAMAYDYYARKNGINVNKLNFKEIDISTKPTESQLRKHKSNEKNRNPK